MVLTDSRLTGQNVAKPSSCLAFMKQPLQVHAVVNFIMYLNGLTEILHCPVNVVSCQWICFLFSLLPLVSVAHVSSLVSSPSLVLPFFSP